MSKIKSKETKLEKDFRKSLWKAGIRYRKNSSKHFGKPDIVIASKKSLFLLIVASGTDAKGTAGYQKIITATGLIK